MDIIVNVISVAPQAPIKDSHPEYQGETRKSTQDTEVKTGRDLTGLHDEVKQHPEVSKFTEITEAKQIAEISGAEAIANFYKVGTKKPTAELFHCKDKNHIVAFLKGEEAYEQLFKDGAYTLFGMGRFFGGFPKNIGKRWLGDNAISLVDNADKKVKYSQVKAELKSGELKAVAIYEQDPKTGKYSNKPKSIALLDKAKEMINDVEKGIPKNSGTHLKELLEKSKHDAHLQKLYQCSLLITDPKAKKHLSEKKHLVKTATLIAETCPKEYQILFPMDLFSDAADDQSRNKDYQSMDWLHPVKKNGKWTSEQGKVTLARARESSQEPISELLAFLNNWHALHEADASIKLSSEDDRKLAEIYEKNRLSIEEYNKNRREVFKASGTEKLVGA